MRGARDPEALAALALAAAAALRVLFFALSFPFFANVDEHRHVDMALKYERGFRPGRDDAAYEAQTLDLVASLGSPEYHRDPARTTPVPPPVWRAPEVRERRLARVRSELGSQRNLDANESPAYYALAGAWLRLGRALGLGGGALLYWLRALAAPAAFALVLATHRGLRAAYPRSRFVRLGAPALLAFLPQDCVTYATPDALSPLLGGVAFAGLVALAVRGAGGPLRGAAVGLAAAAAVLTKLPNALLAAVALFCAAAARGAPAAPRRGTWTALLAALVLPVAAWLVRNWLLLGDPTGDAQKIEKLGWGLRPLAEWPAHPILQPAGLAAFLAELARTFWRGELAWLRVPLAHAAADALYVGVSAAGLALAAAGLAGARPRGERVAEGAAWVALAAALAILVGLSLRFSYGPATNPSTLRPWFANGRLVAGALAPFALLLVRGIEVGASLAPARWRERAAWTALGGVCAAATVSEAILSAPVVASSYNFFHR